jgi:hypothetical protein
MKKPTLEQLLKRKEKAKEVKKQWESHLKDCYRFAMPERQTIDEFSQGAKKNTDVFDSTAIIATQKYANRMQSQVVPPWKHWLMLKAGSEIDKKQHEQVNKYFEEVTEVIFDHINHSNFDTQIHEAFMDMAASTGCILVEEGDGIVSSLNFRCISLSEIIPEKTQSGKVCNVFREFKMPLRDVVEVWENATLSQQMKIDIEKNDGVEYELLEAVLEIENKGEDKYIHYVIHEKTKHILIEEEMTSNPFIVFREAVIPCETIGRGRLMMLLPDIKTLNKIVEFNLRNAALSVSGIYTASDDGVINPYTLRLQPGAIIPVGSNDQANPTLRPLDRSGDFNMAQLIITEYREMINNVMFAQPFGQLSETPVRTATEMGIRQEDLVQTSASAFGRLQSELLEPLLKRIVDILMRQGKIPPMRIDGKEVTIKFTSPMSRSQDNEDIQNVLSFVQSAQMIGPEAFMASVKVDAIPKLLAEKMGIPLELIRTEEEIQAMAAKAEEMMKAQQEQQQPQEPPIMEVPQ